MKYDFLEGAIILVNKPLGWTSFDVVNKIRYKLKHHLKVKKIKVGHAGTLDPLATGLLIICTGKFTKRLNEFQGFDKAYTGTITLGGTTPSFDKETEVDQVFPTQHITKDKLEEARKHFIGDLAQLPPMFSAIKVDGKPLYKQARKGIVVEVKPRPVKIYDFEFLNIEMPQVEFRVECSKGTYIRSLAHDFGKVLRSGGYLSELCRISIGEYQLADAWDLEELIAYIEGGQADF